MPRIDGRGGGAVREVDAEPCCRRERLLGHRVPALTSSGVDHQHIRVFERTPQERSRERRTTLVRRTDDQNGFGGDVLALHAL